MKAIRLTVKNIGIIADAVIELDKPLLLFYGEIRQGKTTLLNAVKWVFGGSFPSDIIRFGETEALIRLDLDCGSITRTWYVSKTDGSTKARPLVFEKGGIPVRDPVAEIKKLLNPFLLDQDYLRNMNELERRKYFASQFAVDTSGLDKEISETEACASEARLRLKAYGEIVPKPCEKPDLLGLRQRRQLLQEAHEARNQEIKQEVEKRRAQYIHTFSLVQQERKLAIEHNDVCQRAKDRAGGLKVQLAQLQSQLDSTLDFLQKNPEKPVPPLPEAPDLPEVSTAVPAEIIQIEDEILKAKEQEFFFEQYEKDKARLEERKRTEEAVLALDAKARELRANRIAKLKQCSEQTGIPGLEFDEAGNFIFEGCHAGMLSTSQIMRLSSLLSGLYPDGFGIELIDRAESLGRSIFEFVNRAKAENKTILASIVGEQPANTPPEVGVFVVENGVIT